MDVETRLRIFWAGKKSRVRLATEAYIKNILKGEWQSQEKVAQLFGTTPTAIRLTLRKMEEEGEIMKHYLGDKYVPHIKFRSVKTSVKLLKQRREKIKTLRKIFKEINMLKKIKDSLCYQKCACYKDDIKKHCKMGVSNLKYFEIDCPLFLLRPPPERKSVKYNVLLSPPMKEFREWHRPIVEWLLSGNCTEKNPIRARDAYLHTTGKGHDIKRSSVIFFLQYLNREGFINRRAEKGRGGYHGVFWAAPGLEGYWAQSLKGSTNDGN
jgi:hypothetical protein